MLFTLPLVDLPIYAYGVMLGLSFIGGYYLAFHFVNREGLPYKGVTWTLIAAIVFALVGARIGHIASNSTWAQIRMQGLFRVLFASRCEGLVAYGGFIGGTLAAVVTARIRRFDFWSLADCASPGLALGLGATRIGCFLAGCCHGQPSDLPWAMVFPPGSQAARVFPDPAAPADAAWSLPVHPTQLYESAVGWLLLPLAIWLLKRRRFTGQSFLIVVAIYAAARFGLEFIRGDDDRGTVLGVFSTSQFIGLALLPLVAGLLLWRWKVGPKPPEPLDREQVRQSLVEQGVIPADKAREKTREGKARKTDAGGGGSVKKNGKKDGKKKKKGKKGRRQQFRTDP
ncbi:MAG: prolipoprotein diacylglyceryl transferase [Deltaproteobacteria bacterium]|nr:prolipoprotein diacylglyceryl transferase [Deltaproteobacteria bacterium]